MKLAVCLAFLCGSALLVAQGIVIKNKNDTNGTDTTPPVVALVTPTSAPSYDAGSASAITVTGTATDATGIAICRWSTDQGGSGTPLTGSPTWATWSIPTVPLAIGTTVLSVSCTDPANNQGTTTLSITRAASSCTTTLSAGANLPSAISSAAAGATICLNSGSYGAVTLGSFTKSPRVTVTALTTGAATFTSIGANSGANGVTLDGFTVTGSQNTYTISGSTTKNVTFSHCAFGTNQLDVVTTNFNNNNILIDACTFGAFDANDFTKEGRLSIYWPSGPGSVVDGVVVTNSTFSGGGCSDGVNLGAYGTVVGPGNFFTNLVQGSCGPHVDSVQGFGQSHTVVNGNYFVNDEVGIGYYDGGFTETFTNNISQQTSNNGKAFQLGHIIGEVFEHNTIFNGTANFNGKPEQGHSSNVLAQDNLLFGDSSFNTTQIGSGPACDSCTLTHNFCSSTGVCTLSSNNVISSTIGFTGGATPSTWGGYRLLSSSPGFGTATSPAGSDMGTTYYGP